MMLNMIKTTQRAVIRAAFAAVFGIGMSCFVPSAQAWTPAELPNLALWLDGSDTGTLFLDTGATQAITNNGAIARWNDKSGNGRNFTQGTAGNRPSFATNSINGLGAATFNGSAGFMSAGDTLDMRTNSLTVMSVVKYNTGTDSGVIIGKTSYRGQAGRWVLYRAKSDGGFGSGTQYNTVLQEGVLPGVVLLVADSSTSAKINGFVLDRSTSGSCKIWDNGTNTASATFTGNTTDFNSPDELWIGAYQNGTGTAPPQGGYLNGKIAEIVVASTNLSTSDRQKVEGYLAWKWGTQASLPADHPYKSVSPFTLQVTVTAPANGQQFLSGSSVTGTVTVANGTMPYAVTFYTNGVSAWSTNNASTNLFTIPLGALAAGTYTNYAMVVDSAGTPVTATSVTNTFTVVATDTTPPTPNPMTFAVVPWAMDNTTMIMTATTATDALSPPVYYYFENTTNSDNSGWITSTVWTNAGLTQGAVYGYRVKARDSATVPNETTNSAVFNAFAVSVETLTWDSNTGTSGAQDGTGDWLAANQWWNGVGNPSWMNAKPNSAVIGNGGAGGTITLGNVIAGSVTFTNFTGTYTLTGGNLTNSAGITVAANAGAVTLSTPIGGSGGMVKNGTSTLTLNNTSTYTGGTVINGGTVNQATSVNGVFGTGPVTLNNGAVLNFSINTLTNLVVVNNGTFNGGNSFGDATAGPITLNGQLTIATGGTGNRHLSGIISGAGSILKTGSGVGSLYLYGANTYSGGTTHQGGILGLGHTNALGTGTLVMDGASQTLTAEANLNVGTGVTNNIVLLKDCTIRLWGNWPPVDYNMLLSGTISGPGGITLTGGLYANKTLFLSGTNTYTGTTTINNLGNLVVSGSLASTNIVVSATRTLVLLNKTSLSTNAVLRYAVGATNTLSYSGKMYIRALYTNNVPLPDGEYGSANLPQFITGAGLLNTGPLPRKGTLISFF